MPANNPSYLSPESQIISNVIFSNSIYGFNKMNFQFEYSGVWQGSCRVSRVFKLRFSVPTAPSLGECDGDN